MIDIVRIYNEIINEFNKHNIKLKNVEFNVDDEFIFPIPEIIESDNFIDNEAVAQYFYIKNEIEAGEDVSELLEEFEYEFDMTFEEMEEAINDIPPYKIIDKNTILYNLITDTYEPMQFEDTYFINLTEFVKEISSIKNKNINIIVNYMEAIRRNLDEFEDEKYTFIDVLNETEFLKNNIDYTELLKNFQKIIKKIFNLNNIYVYDYTKDNRICKLYMDLYFDFNNNIDINYLNTVINDILTKNTVSKKQYEFKLPVKDNNRLLLETTFNLTFNDYVALTKMTILYNIIDLI